MSFEEIEELVFNDNQKLDINDYQTIRDIPNDSIITTEMMYMDMEIYIK
tara:strand:- start:582 stop:728 length:147 start_codon:yes stop_codon:yes gene_type:complete